MSVGVVTNRLIIFQLVHELVQLYTRHLQLVPLCEQKCSQAGQAGPGPVQLTPVCTLLLTKA